MNYRTNAPETGTSVFALKFNGGVVMAADTLAEHGSLAGFKDTKRLRQFGDAAVVGFSGDVSDLQYVDRTINDLEVDASYGGRLSLNAAHLHDYLGKMFYHRRNEPVPLWDQVLVAGFDSDDKPFLEEVDVHGVTFSLPSLAMGYGAVMAHSIMRCYAETEEQAAALSQEQAIEIVRECIKVLYYHDARSLDKYSLAVITKDGVTMSTMEELEKQS